MSEVFSSVSSLLAWVKRYPGLSAVLAGVAVIYNAILAALVLGLVLAVCRPAGEGEQRGSALSILQPKQAAAKQGMTVKEYLAKRPAGPTPVRALVHCQMEYANGGHVFENNIEMRDEDFDQKTAKGSAIFTVPYYSSAGRRLLFQPGPWGSSNGLMTLQIDNGIVKSIVSEN